MTSRDTKPTHRTILTDVDGVLFDWSGPFEKWILENRDYNPSTPLRDHWNVEEWLGITLDETRAMIKEFNAHPDIWPYFEPLPEAVEYVDRLHKEGWSFVAITACATDDWTHANRMSNLRNVFGDAFDGLYCTGLHESKDKFLRRYRPTYWVEDKWAHALNGAELGHQSFIVDYKYNREYSDDRITRVKGWQDIWSHVSALDCVG
jgi:FMN phosphatase YigB (HAD superfamily)